MLLPEYGSLLVAGLSLGIGVASATATDTDGTKQLVALLSNDEAEQDWHEATALLASWLHFDEERLLAKLAGGAGTGFETSFAADSEYGGQDPRVQEAMVLRYMATTNGTSGAVDH